MKGTILIPLTLCALLAGAFVAMPSTALADRDYNRSGSHQVQKHRNDQRHGSQYSNHNRLEYRRAYRHAQKRVLIRPCSYGHECRGYGIHAIPHFHYYPGISIWLRLN